MNKRVLQRSLIENDALREQLAAAEARATAAEQALQEMRAQLWIVTDYPTNGIRGIFTSPQAAEDAITDIRRYHPDLTRSDFTVRTERIRGSAADLGSPQAQGWQPDEIEAVARRWHIAFNGAFRRVTGQHVPVCDGPGCTICLYAASVMTRQRRRPDPPSSVPSSPEGPQ
jgi:hypothetical protein